MWFLYLLQHKDPVQHQQHSSSAWEKVCLWPVTGTQINSRTQSSAQGGIPSYPCFAHALRQKPCTEKAPTHNLQSELSFFSQRSNSTWQAWRVWPWQRSGNARTEKGFLEQNEPTACMSLCRCHVWPYPVWANSVGHCWHWPQKQTDGQTGIWH